VASDDVDQPVAHELGSIFGAMVAEQWMAAISEGRRTAGELCALIRNARYAWPTTETFTAADVFTAARWAAGEDLLDIVAEDF